MILLCMTSILTQRYGNGGLKFKFYIKRGWTKKSYERRDYEAVSGKQQFNTTRAKLHPPVNQ